MRPGARILPAVPRPDISMEEALGHLPVQGIGKAIIILLVGILSPWALLLALHMPGCFLCPVQEAVLLEASSSG